MPAASRIVLAPPEGWNEDRLLSAARSLARPTGPLRPGDAVGELIVVRVEPESGATSSATTTVQILATPRTRSGSPLDVAVLIDAGASMAQPWSSEHSRWSAALAAFQDFIRAPGVPLRLVSVFTFTKRAQLIAGPVARSDAPLPKTTPNGSADLPAALDDTLAYLAEHAERCPQAIIVLSDGASDNAKLAATAARAARLGVQIHVLAFASGTHPAFDKLARTTNGSSTPATHPPGFTLTPDATQETSA